LGCHRHLLQKSSDLLARPLPEYERRRFGLSGAQRQHSRPDLPFPEVVNGRIDPRTHAFHVGDAELIVNVGNVRADL
jgi:hypothetical protein